MFESLNGKTAVITGATGMTLVENEHRPEQLLRYSEPGILFSLSHDIYNDTTTGHKLILI